MSSYLYIVIVPAELPEGETSGALAKFRDDLRLALAPVDPRASVEQRRPPARENTRAVDIRTNLTLTPLGDIVDKCARDNRLRAYLATIRPQRP
jgi:hypothetical protein